MIRLLLDCNNLAHRAFHSTPGLSHGDVKTGVIYGFLRDVAVLRQEFQTDNVVFCFDHNKSLRERHYPWYKAKRREKDKTRTPEELQARGELREQIEALKLRYLPGMGYRNVFFQDGYEADDVIASLCSTRDAKTHYIIVSSDSDLLQLISNHIHVYNPHKRLLWTPITFQRYYNIPVAEWIHVKAMAGDSADDVEGIPGVGQKTALKYLRGELKTKSKTYKTIQGVGWETWKFNLHIVALPWKGVSSFTLREDEVTLDKWKQVASELGIRSLAAPVPAFQPRTNRS